MARGKIVLVDLALPAFWVVQACSKPLQGDVHSSAVEQTFLGRVKFQVGAIRLNLGKQQYFCLGRRFSKHQNTRYAKISGGMPPWLRPWSIRKDLDPSFTVMSLIKVVVVVFVSASESEKKTVRHVFHRVPVNNHCSGGRLIKKQ